MKGCTPRAHGDATAHRRRGSPSSLHCEVTFPFAVDKYLFVGDILRLCKHSSLGFCPLVDPTCSSFYCGLTGMFGLSLSISSLEFVCKEGLSFLPTLYLYLFNDVFISMNSRIFVGSFLDYSSQFSWKRPQSPAEGWEKRYSVNHWR